MCLKILFVMYYFALEFASAASVYDQSQTGDFNVQIDLKDLQIIALSKSSKEEYVDYDYAYDYSEMTIKPQNGTTQKPLNVTTSSTSADVLKDNITIAATVYVETTTESIKNSTEAPADVLEVTKIPVVTTTVKSVHQKTKNTTKRFDTITTAALTAAPVGNATTNCNRGYVHCEAQSQPQNKPLSILEMLSQKFKRRENRKHAETKQT